MLIDGRTLPQGAELAADVCVIGAGPAGLTVAAELQRSPLKVVILERGRKGSPMVAPPSELEFDSLSFQTPQGTRRFQLGGMAAAWDAPLPGRELGARLLPLDEIDFELRSWVPFSGWPLSLSELQPFYERSRAVCGLTTWTEDDRSTVEDQFDRLLPNRFAILPKAYQLVASRVFPDRLVKRLAASRSVTILLSAPARALECDESGTRVTATSVRTASGRSFLVRARVFILAGGAIENARLLLAANGQRSCGLGNETGNVGRFYMDHPYVIAGFLKPNSPRFFDHAGLFDVRRLRGSFVSTAIRLSDETMRRDQLLNSAVNVQARPRQGLIAASRALRESRHIPWKDAMSGRTYGQLREIARRLPGAILDLAPLALRQHRLRPDLAFGSWHGLRHNERRIGHLALILQPEQAPERENRVSLGDSVDATGAQVVRLQWSWSELDLRSIARTRQIIAEEIEAAGVAKVSLAGQELGYELARAGLARSVSPPPDGPPILLMPNGAHHHLGTTRMGQDVATSVVDRDCRVHGVSNLFVAGGSVFPTSGSANPTFTIVALAIRLADHLRGSRDLFRGH
jgi:choline dehydrogenase-like flavoprotein